MQKRTREIIALVILIVLGIAALSFMGWYIFAGHNWNVAASNIDDSVGQMDGYTVFLVEGTRDPEAIAAKLKKEQAAQKAKTDKKDSQNSQDSQYSQDSQESQAKQEDEQDATEDTISRLLKKEQAVDIDELSESYRAKGAEVYRIGARSSGLYDEPLVFSRGEQRIGVFSIKAPARSAAIRMIQKEMNPLKTDFEIALTDDPLLSNEKLPGLDMIVVDVEDVEPSKSFWSDTTFCVSTPLLGQVEAIIVSPSGVISSKTISGSSVSTGTE